MKAFDYFYYISGRFPIKLIITAPDGKVPDFIKTKSPDQEISPLRLYEMFRGTKSHVFTQFLCTLNIFLDGDHQISKDAMTEFYHNLSIQSLSKSNYEVSLAFNRISKLIK